MPGRKGLDCGHGRSVTMKTAFVIVLLALGLASVFCREYLPSLACFFVLFCFVLFYCRLLDAGTVARTDSSAVHQPCLDPQSTFCQDLGGAAQVFRRSPQLGG